jgi:zinc ribbon protein
VIIFGFRRIAHRIAVLTLLCHSCGNPCAQVLRKVVTWFTLFFIPVIPVRTRRSLQCTFCAAESGISKTQAEQLLAQHNQPAPRQPQTPGFPRQG